MKILLIGANSSLSSALKPMLVEFAEVVTAGRSDCDVHLDLSDPIDEIQIPTDSDVVINTAAHIGGNSAREMIAAENINILGTLKLCHACTRSSVNQFVQISSIFAELDPTSPFYNIYSLSKKQGDEAAQLYAASYDLPILIIRPSQLYGVGEAYRKNQPFLYAMMDRAQHNQDIVIFGSNDALRNFIHVEDVAMAIKRAVQGGLIGSYACTYPENMRYSSFASTIISAFNSRSHILFAPEKPDIPDNAFAFDDALFKAIDYFPQISFATGMATEATHRMAMA